MLNSIRRLSSSSFSVKNIHLNETLRSKLKLVQCEYEMLKHKEPEKAPQHLSSSDVEYLLSCWASQQYRKNCWVDVSSIKREEFLVKQAQLESFDGNNICMPFTGKEVEKLSRRKVTSALPFMDKLIIDLSFEKYMSNLECKNLIEQLIRIFQMNKSSLHPSDLFSIHLTDLGNCVSTKKFLDILFPKCQRSLFPNVFLHEESFMQLFSPTQLVYLSPHSDQVLEHFEEGKAYIIGGIVDRREVLSLSMPKSAQLGLATARLPEHCMRSKKLVQSLDGAFKGLCLLKSNLI